MLMDKQGNRTSLLGRVGTQMETKVSKSGKYCQTAFSMSLFSNSVQHSSDNVPSFRILCFWSTSKMGGLAPVDSATISACLLINKTVCVCVGVGQLGKAGQALLLLCLGSNSQRECLGGSAKFFLPTKVFLSDSQAVKLLLERRSVLASLSEEELGRRRRRRPACSQSSTGCAATKSDWTLAS